MLAKQVPVASNEPMKNSFGFTPNIKQSARSGLYNSAMRGTGNGSQITADQTYNTTYMMNQG